MSTTKDNRFIQPYLFFNGSSEEAIEFYRKALGAEVEMMMRFKESPEPPPPGSVPPGVENKIMHSSFRIGQTTVMASDGDSTGKPSSRLFSVALHADRSRSRSRFQCIRGWWTGKTAAYENILLAALRHGGRSVRNRMDD